MVRIGLILLSGTILVPTITNILLLIIRHSPRENLLNRISFGFQKQFQDSIKLKMSLRRSFKKVDIGLVIISPMIKKYMKKQDSKLNSNKKETNIPTIIVPEERSLTEMPERSKHLLIWRNSLDKMTTRMMNSPMVILLMQLPIDQISDKYYYYHI